MPHRMSLEISSPAVARLPRRLARVAAITLLLLPVLVPVAACSSTPRVEPDPLTKAQDPERSAAARRQAIEDLPDAVDAGTVPRRPAREALVGLVWQRRQTRAVRLAAIDSLFALDDPETLNTARELIPQILPTERDRPVAARLSTEAAARGWTEATPAIVRSLSDADRKIADQDRGEYAALQTLHPDRSVEETVFAVFLRPAPNADADPQALSGLEGRVRKDAWELLSRLDASGRARVELLSNLVLEGDLAGDPVLEAMRVGVRIARVIPLTGAELEWLTAMRDPEQLEASGTLWWSQLDTALRSLSMDQRRGMRLRHLEAVRFASIHRAGWLTLSRDDLIDRINARLEDRKTKRRTAAVGLRRRTEFADWQDQLSWPALLSILVIDDAVRDPRVVAGLADQLLEDREDRTTEYGGLVLALDAEATDHARNIGEFRAGLYRPRPAERAGDERFVASRFMIEDSTYAVAHYHFHVQRIDNARYAGPSATDLEYAARYGRLCLVITSVGRDGLNIDLYTPEGAVIDLGMVPLPSE